MSVVKAVKMMNTGLALIRKIRTVTKAYVVLLYHRLYENANGNSSINNNLFIDVKRFSQHLEYINEIGKIISLDEMVSKIVRGEKPDKLYVALTFDDGYADVIKLGLPLFKRYSTSVTFFISTLFIDERSKIPWWDELEMFANTKANISLGFNGCKISYNLKNIKDRNKFVEYVSRKIKYDGINEKDILKVIRDSIPINIPQENGFADWNLLRSAVESGFVSIGGHTVTHPVLSRKGHSEIYEGKKRLEDELNIRVASFAYPYGERMDISREVVTEVKKAGFKAAVTTFSGYNKPNENLFLLRRLKCMGGQTLDYFKTTLETGGLKRYMSNTFHFFKKC